MILTGKAVNSARHAWDRFEVSPSKKRIFFYTRPWLLPGTGSFWKQAPKRLLLLRRYMGHEVERLPVWPENILSVQTTRGGRRRGGWGGINTAGFNIRSKDRHFALYCGTCLGVTWDTWKASVSTGGVCGFGTQSGKVVWGLCFPSSRAVVTSSSSCPSCQHSWFSLIVKVPLFAEESTSSLPHKNYPKLKLQLLKKQNQKKKPTNQHNKNPSKQEAAFLI